MPCRLTTADIRLPTRLGQSAWLRAQLPAETGRCFVDSVMLDEGLTLVYANYTPQHNLLETSTLERQRCALTVTVALEGQSSTVDTNGQRFDFIAGHSTLAAFASVRGERSFPDRSHECAAYFSAYESRRNCTDIDSALAAWFERGRGIGLSRGQSTYREDTSQRGIAAGVGAGGAGG